MDKLDQAKTIAKYVRDPRILIAISNQVVRPLVRTVIGAAGFNCVHEAHEYDPIITTLVEKQIDLVVCGPLRGQDEVGLNLLRTIRKDEKAATSREIPIIMICGNVVANEIFEARDAGVTDFLILPVSPDIVKARVKQAMIKPREFIESNHFIGPDRRRRNAEFKGKNRRL